ncbi:MAG: methionyl-tRNA formyltransferase [Deltaproteobacteria bacterium]|nr:MAG: methionyl-tRNA formyltransferase [Deltaproteobacteria bacterium]
MNKKGPKIVFMGTPEFALPSLKALLEEDYNLICVVTQPDRPKGRGRKLSPPPVKELAAGYGIPVLQPRDASETDFLSSLKEKSPDLIVVVAYGQILKKELLDIPPLGAINVHPSLLPKYRGPAPIQWAIMNNDPVTGVTIIRMNERMDAGPILLQKEVPILPDETAGSLHDRLAEIGARLLIEAIHAIVSGSIKEIPQDDSKATYTPKIDRSLSVIDWSESASSISARIRALDPWPGALARIREREIKLFSSSVVNNEHKGNPGTIHDLLRDGLIVETGNGLVLIKDLQMPGRKRLPAIEFLKGFPLKKGDRFISVKRGACQR